MNDFYCYCYVLIQVSANTTAIEAIQFIIDQFKIQEPVDNFKLYEK